jgi:hypothetical protein
VQALESTKDFSKHRNSLGLHFGHKWFTHFWCANGFQDFATHFWDQVLSQDVAYINDFPFPRLF